MVKSTWMMGLTLAFLLNMAAGCHAQAGGQVNTSEGEKVMVADSSSDLSVMSREDRATGAIIGLLVGDALGMGTHWYYDMAALEKDHGSWVDHYVDPKPDGDHMFAEVSRFRYEQGLRAGDISQTGQVYTQLLTSITEQRRFSPEDFWPRLDKLFSSLSGESYSGRYTESLMKILLKKRRDGLGWDSPGMATGQDTSDGAQLSVLLAATYQEPVVLARETDRLLKVMFNDHSTRGNQIVYALVVQGLINGIAVQDLNIYLKGLAKNPEIFQLVGGYDRFLTPGYGEIAQRQDLVRIDQPKYISHVYGMDCQLMHLLPAVYYLIYRYPDGFEKPVLSASNGGGNNMARAALTGAMAGAANGLSGIPSRFLDGLKEGSELLKLVKQVARSSE